MGRPHHKYQECKTCGVTREQAGHISGTGRCLPCAHAAAQANNEQLREHSGPYFQQWRRQMVASCGGVLLDDL